MLPQLTPLLPLPAADLHVTPDDLRVPSASYHAITNLLLGGNTDRQPLHRLLTPARALADLGVPPDDPLMESLVTDLVWNLRKMTMRQLVQVSRETA